METIPSQRGGKLLAYEGHLYRLNRKMDDKVYWKCRNDNCNVPCTTNAAMDAWVKHPAAHHHPSDQAQVDAFKLVRGVKRKCEEEPERPAKQVYNSMFRNLHAVENADEVAAHLPAYHQVKSSLYRRKRKVLPPLPQRRADVRIGPPYCDTEDGRRFLLSDDGNEDKILIFGTDENIQRMCAAQKVFMDGTFWISPRLFLQMYSVHICEAGVMFPTAYALLPDKTRQTYSRFLRLLQIAATNIGLVFDPANISMDFEQACLQAVRTEFPRAIVNGCLFHFSQSIWRKTQSVGLAADYKNDEEIRKFVRRLASLSFVPLARLDEAWLLITAVAPADPRIVELTDYFVRTWFDDIAPVFSRHLWNHYNDMDEESARTNNVVEGFHSAINKLAGAAHPNVFRLVQILKSQQEKSEGLIRLRRVGQPLPKRRGRVVATSRRLQALKTELESNQRNLLNYLDACSLAVKLG